MARKKRSKYIAKAFESYPNRLGQTYDTSANIFHSMLLSPAWLDLSATAKVLYLVCKDQLYSSKNRPPEEVNESGTAFYMNQGIWLNDYQLYKKGNMAGFYRDMNALIDHGFIRCVYTGRHSKSKSVYDFSDKWRFYGEKGVFNIPDSHRTTAGRSKQDQTKDDVG